MSFCTAEKLYFHKESVHYLLNAAPLYLFVSMPMFFSKEVIHSFTQINIKKEPSSCSFPFVEASGSGLASVGSIVLYTAYYNGINFVE